MVHGRVTGQRGHDLVAAVAAEGDGQAVVGHGHHQGGGRLGDREREPGPVGVVEVGPGHQLAQPGHDGAHPVGVGLSEARTRGRGPSGGAGHPGPLRPVHVEADGLVSRLGHVVTTRAAAIGAG